MANYKKVFNLYCMFFFMLVITLLASCKGKPNYSFTTSEDAVSACKEKLYDLRNIKDADMKDVVEIVNDWTELQDSAYNVLLNDTVGDSNVKLTEQYFVFTDSIRDEITRIAMSKSRSMEDMLYLKIHTATDKEKTQKSELYKSAVAFYESLDNNKTFSNASITLQKYNELLASKPFSGEKDMLEFISKEDQCFRSLLLFLNSIEQKDLQTITQQTASYFDTLSQNVAKNPGNEQAERIRMYLMMRFNRRIIQNAIVCKEDINKNMRLTEIQNANYRWMVIQPFFSIDNYAMALITPKQEKQLTGLAKVLPDLLCTLDGADPNEATPEEKAKLSSILVEYFMKSYLHF